MPQVLQRSGDRPRRSRGARSRSGRRPLLRAALLRWLGRGLLNSRRLLIRVAVQFGVDRAGSALDEPDDAEDQQERDDQDGRPDERAPEHVTFLARRELLASSSESRNPCPLPPGLFAWVARRKGRGAVPATLPAIHATELGTGRHLSRTLTEGAAVSMFRG
jgi:hypothetical protein